LKPTHFEYHAPGSIGQVLECFEAYGDEAKLLAGGQSLIPVLALRLSRFEHLIDLAGVPELQGITRENGSLRIGAMTRQTTVLRDVEVAGSAPLLSRATELIGHFQIRNRGTIGGSIAHADPAAEYPAVVLALAAELEVVGPKGARRVPAADFFQSTFMTALEPDELLAAIHFRVPDPARLARSGFAIEELARRSGDFALAGVACAVELDPDGRIANAAISMFGLDSVPRRSAAAEQILVGCTATEPDWGEVGKRAVADTNPQDDVHAPADYRRRVGEQLVGTAMRRALEEAGTVEAQRGQ
jgi:aerobic carbon-monoxide dehydrogenase medium subunit